MKNGYRSGGHTVHKLRCHIVWIPKYRKIVLKTPIKERAEELLRQACEINKRSIEELNIGEDHVHILIQIGADKALSSVIGREQP
jgi:putative transposase